MRPEEIVDRYLEAVPSAPSPRSRRSSTRYTFREWPNAINPRGRERDLAACRRARARADAARERAFEVHEHLVRRRS